MPSIQVEPPFKVVMTPVEAQTFDVTVSAPNPLVQVFSEGPQGPAGAASTVPGPTGPPGVVISPTEPDDTDVLWADTSEVGDAVVPVGGTTGQSLVKASDADYDSEWADIDGLLPTGGAAGEVLVKQSATDYDAAWFKAVPNRIEPASGQYLAHEQITSSNSVLTLDRMHCVPIYVSNPGVYDRIAIRVQANATVSSVVRLGLYADNNGVPGDLILDAGTVDASSLGAKDLTINVTLPIGWVWLTSVVQGVQGPGIMRFLNTTPRIPVTDALNTIAQVAVCYIRDSVSGALPTPAGVTGVLIASAPAIVLRKA